MTDSSSQAEENAASASRRAFLLGAAGVTGVAVAAGAWRPTAADAQLTAVPSGRRSYVSGYFALKLDDINCGLVEKFQGGDIEGEVTTVPSSDGSYDRKHISAVKYNEFHVETGLAMGKPFQDWIKSALEMKPLRKNGELQAADFKRDIREVREFRDALLTEIGFPACDGAAKDPAYMTLKFAPELTRNKKGSGKVENPVDSKSKTFFPGNFRLTIDGLEEASSRVSKVEALTIKQTTVTNVGDERGYRARAGQDRVPEYQAHGVGGVRARLLGVARGLCRRRQQRRQQAEERIAHLPRPHPAEAVARAHLERPRDLQGHGRGLREQLRQDPPRDLRDVRREHQREVRARNGAAAAAMTSDGLEHPVEAERQQADREHDEAETREDEQGH